MLNFKLDTSRAEILISNTEKAISDFTPIFKKFRMYMISAITLQFNQNSGDIRGGGDARGTHWDYFADQYVRKDGTVVPAWGIPGQVQGRLRHSGQRVKLGDSIMQDTGEMKRAVLSQHSITPKRLVMSTGSGEKKVSCQHRMRNFQYFDLPKDTEVLRKMILAHVQQNSNNEYES